MCLLFTLQFLLCALPLLWNDAELDAAYSFYYKEFSVHLFAAPNTGHLHHCWLLLWALTLRDLVSILLASSSCFPKVLIDKEVRCLPVTREFLDSCQPVTSINVVNLPCRFFFRSFKIKQHSFFCAAKWWSKYISRWAKMAGKNFVKI